MHRQPHAFHLFKVGQERFAAVHRDIDKDLIQRAAPQPIHKIAVVGLYPDAGHLTAELFPARLDQGQPDNPPGPVALQVPDHGLRMGFGGDDPDKAFDPPTVFRTGEHPLEPGVQQRHHDKVEQRHTDCEIAGFHHPRLGHQHQHRIQGCHQEVELDRQLDFLPQAAADDVFILVEAQKRDDEGDGQQRERLHPIREIVGQKYLQRLAEQQQHQRDADGQRQRIRQKDIGVLQLFPFGNHTFPVSFPMLFFHTGAAPPVLKSAVAPAAHPFALPQWSLPLL